MKRLVITFLFAVACLGLNVQAQTTATPQTKQGDETNLETQLYLIVGTNQEVADAKLPSSLDAVVKQMRASLPFKNYRLASTLINRVKNDGRLDLNWIGGPLATSNVSATAPAPSFSYFKVRQVSLVQNSEGQSLVQMLGFNFGTRIPIQTGAFASADKAFPQINYEGTGLATDISMREGDPVVVGTLNVGPSGDAIILVVSAKRTQK
ncbi:MAG TPA: hypothetical protein VL907_12265 [Pyrinomonadaceae bacterium]|nr:hypothetical protein [Pyrinomonadaceae bacterium]